MSDGLEPLTKLINEQALQELYERAEDCRKNALHAMRQNDRELALVYATLYQAENIRIANFFIEEARAYDALTERIKELETELEAANTQWEQR